MNIRRRIFRSYIIVILIVLFYVALSFFLSSFRLSMEKDKNALLEVNILWGDILIFMNETVSNWNDGETYRKFSRNKDTFNERLSALVEESGEGSLYGRDIQEYVANLNHVWQLAIVNLQRLEEIRESEGFVRIEELLIQEPGLQRMYPIYMELISREDPENLFSAYALKEYIDGVEFFPIYSDTMNYLFAVILQLMDREYSRLQALQNSFSIAFFIIFLISLFLITGHFTNALSLPIVNLSKKLKGFIGKSVEPQRSDPEDELLLLEQSVDDLITHYTHLSRLARRLATGHIETSLLDLPRQGVVGNALKEVAAYMKEFAVTADWIRDGQYGMEVALKSPQDVLARSFNFMSREIADKISTLTSMFEVIDEGILLLGMDRRIVETNHRFLNLVGVESQEDLDQCDPLGQLSALNPRLIEKMFCGEAVTDFYCDLYTCRGEVLPVKLNARPLSDNGRDPDGVLLLFSNESIRVRMGREREKLEAQAVEAELRALRAQINPHFFFNTLNTIAHFIETDSSTAVGVVEKLAGLFRYSLISTKRKTVPLSEEILHIKEYLEIEGIRHGSSLNVDYLIDDSAMEVMIPPMLLQPIIENGIKYGGDPEGRIKLKLEIRFSRPDLVIEISDNGTEKVELEGLLNNSRTGLKNVNQRLLTLYRTNLEFEKKETRGLLVRIRIPVKGEYFD